MVFELCTGDLLFEPKSSSSFDKNDGTIQFGMRVINFQIIWDK
jgi:hypothetical protein